MYRTANLIAVLFGLTALYALFFLWLTFMPLRQGSGSIFVVGLGLILLYVGLVMQFWSTVAGRTDGGLGETIVLLGILSLFYALIAAIVVTIVLFQPDSRLIPVMLVLTLPAGAALLYANIYRSASRWQNVRFEDVPDGAYAVIKRNGKVRRLEEPGSIWLRRNDQIAYLIKTDEQQLLARPAILHMGDLVYRYAVRIRYRYAPCPTTPLDPERLRRLSPAEAPDRRADIQDIVQNALYAANAHVYRQVSEGKEADPLTCLLYIVPDVLGDHSVLGHAAGRIIDDLAARDIHVQTEGEGVQLNGLAIPAQLQREATPARLTDLLSRRGLESDDQILDDLFGCIDSADTLPGAPDLHVDLPDADAASPLRESDAEPPNQDLADDAADDAFLDPSAGERDPEPAAFRYTLTPRDLGLLKEVPAPEPSESIAAGLSEAADGTGGANTDGIHYTLTPADLAILQSIPE